MSTNLSSRTHSFFGQIVLFSGTAIPRTLSMLATCSTTQLSPRSRQSLSGPLQSLSAALCWPLFSLPLWFMLDMFQVILIGDISDSSSPLVTAALPVTVFKF